MASKLLGRTPCVEPRCGFQSAHIKINIDTEGKKPYRHCPECGSQYFPRTATQVANMLHGMRPEGDTAPPPPTEPIDKPAPSVKPIEPEPKYKIVFGVRVPA